ncbi:UDP-glucose/GDP-mannose dehydrogenase family protein [Compostibacter hankyongensis]|uniref:UDP-glucose 6-dehydrogenase n=1 Tax=Compostibacter hankyongensis TaxID=1007089 RepID=A0ABP8G8D5_9BACT
MKAIVVGTGYVGLVTGACLADTGVHVSCIDIDERKINMLKGERLPIYETGLEEIVRRNMKKGRLEFGTSLAEFLQGAEVIFIAVGTPPDEDGSANLRHVLAVATAIGEALQDYAVVVTKSTVPVGTSAKVKAFIAAAMDKRGRKISFDVASNPEFLKEGAAVQDFLSPDRIVIGTDSMRARNVLDQLYKPFQLNRYRIIHMDIASAEMTKYAANAMLAARISFMNDMANLCEFVDADINQVRNGIGADPRIGSKFLYPGVGYGGSCFPKDVKALIHTGKYYGHRLRLLEAVEAINEDQKQVLFKKLLYFLDNDLEGKQIAIWGLAFKPNTDDMREAPALTIIEALIKAGAGVRAYDPMATGEARKQIAADVIYAQNEYEAVDGADALMLLTEWPEFRLPDWKRVKRLMQLPLVLDGRNIYNPQQLRSLGFVYHGIGTKNGTLAALEKSLYAGA